MGPGALVAASLLVWGTGLVPASAPDDDVAAHAPELCRAPVRPLDDTGRRLLVTLETRLAREVLGKAPAENMFDAGDFRSLVDEYPETEVVFVFPDRIRLPKSRLHARTSTARGLVSLLGPPAVSMRLSDVKMASRGGRNALILDYDSGPIGPAPHGTIWVFGESGTFCAIPRARGRWSVFPMSALIGS